MKESDAVVNSRFMEEIASHFMKTVGIRESELKHKLLTLALNERIFFTSLSSDYWRLGKNRSMRHLSRCTRSRAGT